jgi:hypothetical protein
VAAGAELCLGEVVDFCADENDEAIMNDAIPSRVIHENDFPAIDMNEEPFLVI